MGAQLRRLRIQIEQAQSVVQAEACEVERLERSVVRRAWWSAMGQPSRLERERDEARSAAVRLEAFEAEFEAVAAALESISGELSTLEGIDAAYDRAFDTRLQELVEAPGPDGEVVRALLVELEETSRRAGRIDEALAMAREVDRNLADVVETLERVRRVDARHPGRGPSKWLGPQLERVRRRVEGPSVLPPLADDVRRLLAQVPLVQRGNPVATREAHRRGAGALERLRRGKAALREERAEVAARYDDAKRRLVDVVERS